MSEREEKLERVAEAIADDLPIQWADAEDPWLDTRMRNLRELERIRIVYRDIETSSGAPRPLTDRTAPGRARNGSVAGGAGRAGGGGSRPATRWGDLELVERIGAGGGGEVYRAWDPALRTDVALKLLPADLPEGAATPAQFLEEARQLAKVRHPNVVTVHGAARHDGRVGLWMDYVQGRTLEQDLRERGPWSAEEAALIGLDLVRALAAVHAADLVHRDVKTSNVMRERGGRVLLMDFGTAVEQPQLPELSAGDSFVGTARFMAPEIFRGERISRASDIYSLGVVLYRLVTGQYPVDAPDAVHLRDKHIRGESTPLREARADLPLPFVRVVDRALAGDPAHRYANVAEMEKDLAAYLGREPEKEVDEPTGRRRLLAGLALAAAFAAVAWFGTRAFIPPAFEVDAELFRIRDGAEERLRAGSQVGPGDRLFLEVASSRELYAYVFNEDDAGNSYALFPLDDLPLSNPLPPDATHRLPGAREGGAQITWDVTSAGGRERIYVVAATSPLEDLETEIARLPQAGAGVPAKALSREAVRVLHRGLGGVSEVMPEEGGGEVPLSDVFGRAADRADGKDGVWAWSITLENPAP